MGYDDDATASATISIIMYNMRNSDDHTHQTHVYGIGLDLLFAGWLLLLAIGGHRHHAIDSRQAMSVDDAWLLDRMARRLRMLRDLLHAIHPLGHLILRLFLSRWSRCGAGVD